MAEGISPIYIAGRAHSGSTFLDVLLNGADGVKGCGGVVEGWARGPEEQCSCGALIPDCEKWGAIATAYERRSGRTLQGDIPALYARTDIRHFRAALKADVTDPNSPWHFYADATNHLSASIGEVFGVTAYVDSNKEYTRALMLLTSDPEARVIHIFRDADITIASHYHRLKGGSPIKFMKRKFEPGLMTAPFLMLIALGWSVGMIAAIRIARKYPDRVLHLSHDALSRDPRTQLERLQGFLGIDLSEVITKVETRADFDIAHILGGNDFKHKGKIAFIPNTKGRRHAPWLLKMAARIPALPGIIARRLWVKDA